MGGDCLAGCVTPVEVKARTRGPIVTLPTPFTANFKVDHQAVRNIARLQADGSLDTTLQNGMSGLVGDCWAIALQPDGKILIGGWFNTVNGVARTNIARLNANGSLDTSFQVALAEGSPYVYAIRLQSDGKILVGGRDLRIEGVTLYVCARLNLDGSLDDSFIPAMDQGGGGRIKYARAIALQADGRILFGGMFNFLNGFTRHNVDRLLA